MIRIFLLALSYVASVVAYDYQLGVIMIFRDEAPFLKEWIEYHRLVGVEHFWLFNNLSKDNYEEVLKPYVEEGIVDLIEVPIESLNLTRWNSLQTRSYNRGLSLAKGKCKWTAVIDADEFVVPVVADTIVEALKVYDEYPGVALHWLIFGTSFVEKIPPKTLMMEALCLRGKIDLDENKFVKLIVKPSEAVGFNGPHMCAFKKGSAVSTDFRPVKHKLDHVSHEVLRINHYWSRDMDYLMNVKMPRSKTSGGSWATHMEKEINLFNVESDDAILRFIPELKKRMGLF